MSLTKLQNYFAPLKRVLPPAIWQPIRALATGIITPIRFSQCTGHWISSLRMSACSPNGAPIPWYTYPAIDFLAQRNFKNRNVLEFGGGQSTLWWAARARSVLTIEENSDWYERLRSQIGSNVTLHHLPADRATGAVTSIKSAIDASPVRAFDVIVVDGHLRRKLTGLAFSYLGPGGALLLDNSERYGFYDETKTRNCRRIDFFGFAPGVSLRHCTSLVFVGDCFLLQPDIPISVIEMMES
jgi:predicted O-methyltransferase YrrM